MTNMVRVNVNTADMDKLKTVPGIGPKGARSIIELREAVGIISECDLKTLPLFRNFWLSFVSFYDPTVSSPANIQDNQSPPSDGATGGQPLPIGEVLKLNLPPDEEDEIAEPGDGVASSFLQERAKFEREQERFILDKIEMEKAVAAERQAVELNRKRAITAAEERSRKEHAEMQRHLNEERLGFEEHLKLIQKQNKELLEEHIAEFQSQINDLRRENDNVLRLKQLDEREIKRLENVIVTERRNVHQDFEREVERKIVDQNSRREFSSKSYTGSNKSLGSGRSHNSVSQNLEALKELSSPPVEDDYIPDERLSKSRGRDNEPHAQGQGRYRGDDSTSRGKSPVNKLPMIPKSIRFTGESESNWPAFVAKFDLFCKVHKFTKNEKFNNFCWCLEGKASVYFALVTKRNPDLNIDDLYSLFETRFDFKDLEETALLRFQSAVQGPCEPLEEWADRTLQLADKAFKQYSTQHMHKQACMRFCQGVFDKKAAQCVANQRPVTMESALEKMRLFQYNEQLINKPSLRKTVNAVEYSDDEDDRPLAIQAISSNSRVPRPRSSPVYPKSLTHTEDRLSRVEEKLSKIPVIEDSLKKLSTQMELLLATQPSRQRSFSPMRKELGYRQSRSPSPRRFSDACFTCNEKGHFMADCPNNKKVKFAALKETGSDVMA